MENLIDLIIPIIFIATFILNGLFKPDKKKQGKPGEASTSEPEVEDRDPLAELREEIRRRIEANQRGSAETEAPRPEPTSEESRPSMRTEPSPTAPLPRSSSGSSERFDAQDREAAERLRKMQEMQDQVRAMQARAAQEQSKADSLRQGDAWKQKDASTRSYRRYQRSRLVKEVMRDLREPGSSRKAVLNAEILGTPVGLRRPHQSQSLWDN